MPDVRFRSRLRRLLDELRGDAPDDLFEPNVAKIEEATGVNRQTIHNWIKADSDDDNEWLHRYDPENARRLNEYFSEMLGRDVEVMERIEIDDSPSVQETVAVAA